MSKLGRNAPCKCGSGKKYKKCCLNSFASRKNLGNKLITGDMNVFARVISSDGEASSFEIAKMSITKDGVETVLIDEEINLRTNSIPEDTTSNSVAIISIPVNDNSKGNVTTIGNAEVSNKQKNKELRIDGGNNKLKINSPQGRFAVIKISTQRSTNSEYLSIFFGIRGQVEFTNSQGRKNRSHVDLFPSGNTKFIRLSDEDGNFDETWTIENKINYLPQQKAMCPLSVTISSTNHEEKLTLNFRNEENITILISGTFE
jgi:hypothetical protein